MSRSILVALLLASLPVTAAAVGRAQAGELPLDPRAQVELAVAAIEAPPGEADARARADARAAEAARTPAEAPAAASVPSPGADAAAAGASSPGADAPALGAAPAGLPSEAAPPVRAAALRETVTLAELELRGEAAAQAGAQVRAEVVRPASQGLGFRLLPRKKSLALFLASQAVVLVDMGQTLGIRHHPEVVEANPLFGREPSDGQVYAVSGARLALNTLAYLLLPDRWANMASVLNLAVGIPVVANNASLGLSVRF